MPLSIVSFLQKVDGVILNPLLEILFSVAFLYFIFAIIKLIQADGSDKAEARKAVMWSLVGMFVMISTYGIINLIVRTFEITDSNSTSFIQQKL